MDHQGDILQLQNKKEEVLSARLPPRLVAGCRKSELALIQARHINSLLAASLSPAPEFTVTTRSVAGDADKQTPFLLLSKQVGGSDVGKSLWTNGLEEDLLARNFDFLVHCLKDMPTTLPPNFILGAICEREDPSDAVIMRPDSEFTSIDQLPAGSVVGTSSSRRKALVRRNWPHLEVRECRGNVETRLAKLDAPDSPFSCILLATSGLLRLNLGHRITQKLEASVFPYAVGQGALGIELRTDQEDMLRLVQAVDHVPSRRRGLAERAMLRTLQGGCSSPIGVSSHFKPGSTEDSGRSEGSLHLHATVLSVDGTASIDAGASSIVRSDDEAEKLGISVAQSLMDKGANNLLVRPS